PRAASARARRVRRAARRRPRARSSRPRSPYRRPASTLLDLHRSPGASMPQTDREARSRQDSLPRLRPLDERDRPVEVRLEISPLRRRDTLEAVEVEVGDLDAVAVVAMADRVGRASHGLRYRECAARATDDARRPGAERPRDSDDVAQREPPRELGGERLRLLRRIA